MCASCKEPLPNEEFDNASAGNHWKLEREVVCNTCKTRGCSNGDPTLYSCTGFCGERYGHKQFYPNQMKNFKNKLRKKLVCKQCENNQKAKVKELTRLLKTKEAFKCSCRYKMGHDEKCKLFPSRWPGYNLITREEYTWWKENTDKEQ